VYSNESAPVKVIGKYRRADVYSRRREDPIEPVGADCRPAYTPFCRLITSENTGGAWHVPDTEGRRNATVLLSASSGLRMGEVLPEPDAQFTSRNLRNYASLTPSFLTLKFSISFTQEISIP